MTDREKLAQAERSIERARQWIRHSLDSLAGIHCAKYPGAAYPETVDNLQLALRSIDKAEERRARIVSTREESEWTG